MTRYTVVPSTLLPSPRASVWGVSAALVAVVPASAETSSVTLPTAEVSAHWRFQGTPLELNPTRQQQ